MEPKIIVKLSEHEQDAFTRWIKSSLSRFTRALGIPVETYMLAIEGERIMKDLYPKQFDDNGICMFKFSNG